MAKRTYRILSGVHYERDSKGVQVERTVGEIVVLDDKEYPAFADKLEPYNPSMANKGVQAALADPPLDEGAEHDDSDKGDDKGE